MLKGITRDSIAKGSTKQLKRDGYLIANIYGKGISNINAAFKLNDYIRALRAKEDIAFDVEIDGEEEEHDFRFTQLSAKELQELSDEKFSFKAQHEKLKENTKCITEGIGEDKAEEIVETLFESIWTQTEPGSWSEQMQELLGNGKKKK